MGERAEKIVPDTTAIVDGVLSGQIEEGILKPELVMINDAVLPWLEEKARNSVSSGFLGIEELNRLRALSGKHGFSMRFGGEAPNKNEDIDCVIRNFAHDVDAVLVTSSGMLAKSAAAKGVRHILVEPEKNRSKLMIEDFFGKDTMSIHLREDNEGFAKKGVPGDWRLEAFSDQPLTRERMMQLSSEIMKEAETRDDSFIETERKGSTIVQLGEYRIVIARPPFSDSLEITAARPVKRLSISDYRLSEKLSARVREQAEGILIAGAPGMGKSTFAQALAEHYASMSRIVKTIESPRDLLLGGSITQYAISHGDSKEVRDILLLSRPDNAVFDEMRNTSDFRLFADLRLAGIGLAGVVHATNPVDAVQRFVGRIELGMIPHVIDTVIFIKDGKVEKVLALQMVVKVPAGMTEADLARPVVAVADFETGKSEFEIYSYGEETVVVPVIGKSAAPSDLLAARHLESLFPIEVRAEMISGNKAVVYAPKEKIKEIVGINGRSIEKIEKKAGISIDVEELKEERSALDFSTKAGNSSIYFMLEARHKGSDIDIHVGGDYLLTAKAGKNASIKVKKDNRIGRLILDAVNSGEKIELRG